MVQPISSLALALSLYVPLTSNTLFFRSIAVVNSTPNEVRTEESCRALNRGCSGDAGCCCHGRGAAAEEGFPDRIHTPGAASRSERRSIPPGVARTRLHRGAKHRH